MTAEPTMTLRVARYRPEREATPTVQSYTIPYRDDMVVLDALNYVKSYLDGSLSFRWSCRMGICGSCGMNVNGRPTLTCAAFLRDYYPREVTIEPLSNFPVIRDLVIDMSDFMHKLSAVQPWIIREHEKPISDGEYLQTPDQLDAYHQFSACINCMLCYAACPVYGMDQDFLGPAAIALGRRYNLDSRDQGAMKRLEVLANNHGVRDCTFVGECSVVCPKDVDPAKAIQQSKLDTTLHWYKRLLLPWARR